MDSYCSDSSDTEISLPDTIDAWVWIHVKKPRTFEEMYYDAHEQIFKSNWTVYYVDPEELDNKKRRLVLKITMTHHVSLKARDYEIQHQLRDDIDGCLQVYYHNPAAFGISCSCCAFEGEEVIGAGAGDETGDEDDEEDEEDEGSDTEEAETEAEGDEEMTDYGTEAEEGEDEEEADKETTEAKESEAEEKSDDEPVSRAQLRPKFSSPVPDKYDSDGDTVVPSDVETVTGADTDAEDFTVVESDADDDSDVETGRQLPLKKKTVSESPSVVDSESKIDTDDIVGAQTPEE